MLVLGYRGRLLVWHLNDLRFYTLAMSFGHSPQFYQPHRSPVTFCHYRTALLVQGEGERRLD
jgi:hypothetical protein